MGMIHFYILIGFKIIHNKKIDIYRTDFQEMFIDYCTFLLFIKYNVYLKKRLNSILD